jgi:hypothetical protein
MPGRCLESGAQLVHATVIQMRTPFCGSLNPANWVGVSKNERRQQGANGMAKVCCAKRGWDVADAGP